MPTYSYACTECGHRFDAVQSFTDANLTECPTCSGKLRKLFNSVGIVFKGSGFYRTDSRAGAVVDGAKTEKIAAKSESSSSESSSSSGSSDTKKDAKKSDSSSAKKTPSTVGSGSQSKDS